MRITVLAGGIGGARFLRGVRAARPDDDITAVVNTGDDVTLHGLRITPDLDSCMYTLAGVHDGERGWGRVGETWRIMDELKAYGAEPSWFNLGDLDIGTHLVRTRMLDAGYPLSAVTAALCERWQLGLTLLPSGCVEVDAMQRTSLPGVHAAGDMAHHPELGMPMASVLTAAASGLVAGAALAAYLV